MEKTLQVSSGNLTPAEIKTIQALPVHIQPVVMARFKKPIRDYDDFSLATELKNMVIVAFTELGIGIDGKDDTITFLRETLLRDLRVPKYTHLSLDLIKIFISNGIRGQYGTFKNQLNTINIQNIHHWINEGLKSEEYKRSVTEFNRKMDEEEVKTSKVPVIYSPDQLKSHAKEAFDHYVSKGEMPIPGASAVFYNTIKDALGVSTLINKLDWASVREVAKKSYYDSMCEGKTKREIRELKLDYSLENRSFEFHVKKVGLKYFFDRLISEGKDMEL